MGGFPARRAKLASARASFTFTFTGTVSHHTKHSNRGLTVKAKPRRCCYRCVGAARASTSCLHRPRPIRAHDVVARSWPRCLSRPPAAPRTPLGLLEPTRQQHIQHVAEARSALTCGAAAMASRRCCAIEQAMRGQRSCSSRSARSLELALEALAFVFQGCG